MQKRYRLGVAERINLYTSFQVKRKVTHMERIKSFSVDHMTLLPGVYVSRTDYANAADATSSLFAPQDGGQDALCPVTTYDIRMTRPNFEPVMSTSEIHAIEHLGATYLRNRADVAHRVIYWGPMGCRTGFYLILSGAPALSDVITLMRDTFRFITGFEGKVPGASPEECGNYSDMDPDAAKKRAEGYLTVLEK